MIWRARSLLMIYRWYGQGTSAKHGFIMPLNVAALNYYENSSYWALT